jgi:hypothetical protein
MAFPYVFESNFESGSNAEWDSETDTASILDFPHFTELARYPWSKCAPNRGAYCMRVRAGGQTADAILIEGDIDIAAAATSYFRFYLYFGEDFTATVNDTFNLFELQQVGGTVEGAFGARVVAATNTIDIGLGELGPTQWYAVSRNKWYCIEIAATCDSGPNDGVLTLYVDGALAATVTTIDQGVIGRGVLGLQDYNSTTSGTILFDNFVQDDTRVGVFGTANPYVMTLTKSGHVFVGPGTLSEVDLLSGAGTDCVVTVYDTNTADTTNSNMVLRLNNTTSNEFVPSGPLEDRMFTKGCYITLTGTNPRALVNICRAPCLNRVVLREWAKG